MAVFWDRVTGVQHAPPGWAVAVSAAVALLIVLSPRLWRLTRIAITIAHEGGHAVVSLLSGRRLEGIRLHADTSGETRSRGRRNGPGVVLTALAGYLTPPLLGAGAAALLGTHRVTLLLSLLLVMLAATLLMVRNWYGVLAVLATAGALLAVIWLAGPALRGAFGYGVAWFLLFGGVRPVAELARTRRQAKRRSPGQRLASGQAAAAASDADQLAWLTGVPAGLWVFLFALVATGALVLGARLLIPWPAHLFPRASAQRQVTPSASQSARRAGKHSSQSARPCPGLRSDDRGTREERRGKDRGPERAAASGETQRAGKLSITAPAATSSAR